MTWQAPKSLVYFNETNIGDHLWCIMSMVYARKMTRNYNQMTQTQNET